MVTLTAVPTAPVERKPLRKIKDTTQYYAHQVVGIRELAPRASFLLADDMGLGKSLEALTVAAIDFEMGYASRVLYVTLGSLKENVQESDIQEHTLFTSMVLPKGPPTKRDKALAEFAGSDTDILVVGYEQVIKHVDQLNAIGFDIVILDECHVIKSPSSQRSKAIHKLRADRFFALTGSPMLNKPDELWSILHRLHPDAFPKYWTFRNRYSVFGGFKGKAIVGIKNETELHQKLSSYMLRRLKKDCLDLPDKQHVKVLVDLLPEQRRLYNQAKEELKIELPGDAAGLQLENGLTKALRLKQICGTTACIPGYDDFSAKLDAAEDKIQEIIDGGRPTVVFTQFRDVLACMASRLEKRGIPVWQLHGHVPTDKRKGVVNDWTGATRAGQPGVMLGMLQVAGTGLNMTVSNTVHFLDKLWVPDLNTQAEDRCHRIGADKTQPVIVYSYICRKTYEQRIEKILSGKQDMVTAVVETSDFKKALYAALLEEEQEAA